MAQNSFGHDLSQLDPRALKALQRAASYYIGGRFIPASKTLPVFDPSSGECISSIGAGGAAEINEAVVQARRALHADEWANIGPVARERLLHRLALLIEENAAWIAQVETVDNGMPYGFAFGGSVMGAASVYRYYAGWPSKITGEYRPVDGPPGSGSYIGLTSREPVGVVAAITPWNVPFMMAAWKLAPALAAGCTVVLKPAEDTSLTASILADLVHEAGFPPGVVNIVSGLGSEAGAALVQHPGIDKISFTGSTSTGRIIGEIAGRNLKKHTLELGGKSPTLIFDDADLEKAARGAAESIFLNSGQICVAGSRLYIQDNIYDKVMHYLLENLAQISVGSGLQPDVFMGPLVNKAQKDKVQSYIDGAKARGLKVFQGVNVTEAHGYFVSPTVITGADANDSITCEEIFGPVLSVYRFKDEEEVISAANKSIYGLAATVWTKDNSRIMRLSSVLECGKVIINNAGFPYPGLPEGGVKGSGHGKDLGREGLEQCLQTKTVLMAL